MVKKIGFIIFFLAFLSSATCFAANNKMVSSSSVLIESEGMACLGQDHTRKQTQRIALDNAKQSASELAATHVFRNTVVENGAAKKDVIDVSSSSKVKVVKVIKKGWMKSTDASGYSDQCYKISIMSEVTPKSPLENKDKNLNDPRAPLTVELWTDKDQYSLGDYMKFYFRGNKPFYARAVYEDAEGNLIEVTRAGQSNYYKGGTLYEIPGHEDQFTLEITPPFGSEKLVLYASTSPMGRYEGQKLGNLFLLKKEQSDIGTRTRGLTILKNSNSGAKKSKSEFAEAEVHVIIKK